MGQSLNAVLYVKKSVSAPELSAAGNACCFSTGQSGLWAGFCDTGLFSEWNDRCCRARYGRWTAEPNPCSVLPRPNQWEGLHCRVVCLLRPVKKHGVLFLRGVGPLLDHQTTAKEITCRTLHRLARGAQ